METDNHFLLFVQSSDLMQRCEASGRGGLWLELTLWAQLRSQWHRLGTSYVERPPPRISSGADYTTITVQDGCRMPIRSVCAASQGQSCCLVYPEAFDLTEVFRCAARTLSASRGHALRGTQACWRHDRFQSCPAGWLPTRWCGGGTR